MPAFDRSKRGPVANGIISAFGLFETREGIHILLSPIGSGAARTQPATMDRAIERLIG
jgi:hypothetical protein